MSENKKIDKMVESSIKQVADMIDANTIIGKPIMTPSGFHLVPISKVSMGLLSGGGEYGETKVKKESEFPFSGGTGAIVNLKPCAFLVDDGKECKLMKIGDDAFEEILIKAGDAIRDFIQS
ncbi:MAG: sporulation protein YtfJ [Clostridia bacterium]|nr:sporulation protein YtfJ [Clostridia bacterium]